MPDLSTDKKFMDTTLLDKIREIIEVDGNRKKLVVDKIEVVRKKDDEDFDQIKKAKLSGQSWADPVMADVRLIEKASGMVLDKQRINVASLPRKTQHKTFIVDGTEYQSTGQVRLHAAPYTRVRDNGEKVTEIRTERGKTFSIVLDPKNLVFAVHIGGKKGIKLINILRVLGVPDARMKEAWGVQIYDANVNASGDGQLKKIYDEFVKGAYEKVPTDDGDLAKAIITYFNEEADIDPTATMITTGMAKSTADGDVLVASSKKLVDLHAGRIGPDNRDTLAFKKYHALEDQLIERLDKSKKKIQGAIRGRLASNRDSVRRVLSPARGVGREIKETFTRTKLQHSGETTNWLDMLSGDSKVTIMGEGGIKDVHTVRPEMRDLDAGATGFMDSVKTAAGEAGVAVHRALGTSVKGNKLITTVVDVKTGKNRKINQMDVHGEVIAFPGEGTFQNGKWVPNGKTVTAVKNGEFSRVAPGEVTAIFSDARTLYSEVTNLIPFLNNNAGARAILGTAQMTQAVPLKDREAALVQSEARPGLSFDKLIGHQSVVKAPVDGTVKRVSDGMITYVTKNGKLERSKLMDNMPLEQGGFLNHEPIVKAGDEVKKGQIVADSNFTRGGELALGRNLTTAYMPYKGYTMEDGIVISETAAKKMTSEHVYTLKDKLTKERTLNRGMFESEIPISADNSAMLDADGLILKGSVVKRGDIMATIVTENMGNSDAMMMGSVTRGSKKPIMADPIVWERDVPGEIKDVVKHGSNIAITVKTTEPMIEADKFTNRHGGKGVVTLILPDEQMPQTQDGNPIDIIVDPHGVPSRANVGQILELGAGKLADKQGRPYLVENFDGMNKAQVVMSQLAEAGLTDKETVIDPETGREIPNIAVGKEYFMKLRHQAETKMKTKTYDSGHDIDESPIKGQSLDFLGRYSLVGHGARANLSEMATMKTGINNDFWRDIIEGRAIVSKPKVPFTTEKFESMLKGMGINIRRDRTGHKLKILPLTDKEVYDPKDPHRSLSNGKLIGVDIVKNDTLDPIPGGLFDPGITGGKDGTEWSHIELPEAVLNPIFAPAVAKITGQTQKFVEEVASGRAEVDGLTASKGISHLLGQVNVERELEVAKTLAKNSSKDRRDDLNRKARYLQSLVDNKMTPEDAYMMKNIPVPPPTMRPVRELEDGSRMVADVNYIYRDLALLANQQWDRAITSKAKNEMRKDIYDEVKALTGLGDVPHAGKRLGYKGYAEQLFAGRNSGSAKEGYFQRKATKKRNVQTARSVITVNPDLAVDEIGLPEDMAWDMYKPFILRRMVRNGYSMSSANQSFEDRDELATSSMMAEMEARPVLANRAPSWHRYNIMGHKPKLSKGKNMELPALPIGPYYGGDFDGDAMAAHLPITREAVKEAFERTPAKVYWEHGTGNSLLALSESAVIGMSALLERPAGERVDFKTEKEAVEAYNRGEIKANQPIVISGKIDKYKATPGAIIVNDILPDKYDIIPGEKVMDKKAIRNLMLIIAQEEPKKFPDIINKLNQAATIAATYSGFSIGVSDLVIDDAGIQNAVAKMEKQLLGARASQKGKIYDDAVDSIEAELRNIPMTNTFGKMLGLQSKGNITNIRQILGAPMVFKTSTGKDIDVPVGTPFAKGVSPAEYHIQQTGGRGGLVQRASETSRPGDKGKELLNLLDGYTVSINDCGVQRGIKMNISNQNILDRYLAVDHKGGAKRNDIVTQSLIQRMIKAGVKEVEVRSPMECLAKDGVCVKCYGLQEGGRNVQIGENVGVQDAQSIIDTSSKLTLKAFHTTGARDSSETKFDRYERLLNMSERIKNQAPVSTLSGQIQEIRKNALGGWNVKIDGSDHVVDKALGLSPLVVEGGEVKAGDKLSLGGDMRPQDVLEYRGVSAARGHVANELGELFDANRPGGISARTMESIAANMINAGIVTDPGDSSYISGDRVKLSRILDFNRSNKQTSRVSGAYGKVLAEPAGTYDAGIELGEMDLEDLRKQGIKTVEVAKNPVKFEAIAKSLGSLPGLINDGWIEKLESRALKTRHSAQLWRGWNQISHQVVRLQQCCMVTMSSVDS